MGVASFVDRDLLEPGVSVLVNSLVGIAPLPSRSVDVRGGNRPGEHQQLCGRHARRKGPRRNLRRHWRSGRANHGNQGPAMQCVLSVGVRGAAADASRTLRRNRRETAKGRYFVRRAGNGQNAVGEGSGEQDVGDAVRLPRGRVVAGDHADRARAEGGFWNCVSRTGPKLVRDIFSTARDLAPSIVFIDEIDSIGTKRYDADSSGAREVQRTMLELLNQLDGFDDRGDVKVIMATNRIETLDPALLRPGRIDRKIKLPLPDAESKRRIFNIHTVSSNEGCEG